LFLVACLPFIKKASTSDLVTVVDVFDLLGLGVEILDVDEAVLVVNFIDKL